MAAFAFIPGMHAADLAPCGGTDIEGCQRVNDAAPETEPASGIPCL